MPFNITVTGVEEVQRNGYKFVKVQYSYKGKSAEKDLATFGASKDVAKIMRNASEGEVYAIETAENAKGYKDWVKASQSGASDDGDSASSSARNVGHAQGPRQFRAGDNSSRESPEERAKRQLYIVRQSSLSASVEILKTRGLPFGETECIDMAENLVKWVFSQPETGLNDEV